MVRYLKLKILLVRLRWGVAKNQKNNFVSIVNFMYVWGAGGAPESAHGGVDVIMWEKRFGGRESLETRNRGWRGHEGHVPQAVLFSHIH